MNYGNLIQILEGLVKYSLIDPNLPVYGNVIVVKNKSLSNINHTSQFLITSTNTIFCTLQQWISDVLEQITEHHADASKQIKQCEDHTTEIKVRFIHIWVHL